jgi:DDE superfamily endonuclease
LTSLVERALHRYVPTADELDDRKQYLVDGTLLPCWSWADHPELYSSKHNATGLNVQVLGTLDGELVWISDPIDGSRHDMHCLRESGALTFDAAHNWTGGKGYVGGGMLTPINIIEQIIANFKTWRIMRTDYRRPPATFTTTIAAVVALHFYRAA